MNKNFYTYIYLDPTKSGNYNYGEFNFKYEPFYVGEGQHKRFMGHMKESIEDNCNKHKIYRIQKIKKDSGLNPIIIKIKENLTKKQAQKLEIKLIKLIGRRDKKLGPLTNLTNGGDGVVGSIRTPEMKLHQSMMQKGRKKNYIPDERTAIKLKETKQQVKLKNSILQYDLNGIFIKEWDNLRDLRDFFESPSKIQRCCNSNKSKIYYRAGKSKLFLWAYHRLYNFIWLWDNGSKEKINTTTILKYPIIEISGIKIINEYKTMKELFAVGLDSNRFLSKLQNFNETTYKNKYYKLKIK